MFMRICFFRRAAACAQIGAVGENFDRSFWKCAEVLHAPVKQLESIEGIGHGQGQEIEVHQFRKKKPLLNLDQTFGS